MKTNGLWFVAATVGGYLVFNLVICGFGGSIATMGLMNLAAGAVNLGIAHYLKQRPPIRWGVATIGMGGVVAIATGLGQAYRALPAETVVSLSYDLVVVSLAFFFWMVPERQARPPPKVSPPAKNERTCLVCGKVNFQ
ncbi:MAG: hypothetical protein UY79_C0016G0007 [Parcubacteria group bacterium GW2011_GWA2_53_21]|nr:MAG: hypothetical protein UY79_C0016G0007 [Parcubacteria group bacterium GW2011_GWA2_53_21]